MRHHYNKKLERQILVSRKLDEEERKEVKRIDLRLKRKKTSSNPHRRGTFQKLWRPTVTEAPRTRLIGRNTNGDQ